MSAALDTRGASRKLDGVSEYDIRSPMTTTGTNLLGLRYRRAWEHSDAAIKALPIDAPDYVPWWPRPDVKLFNIMVHLLTETSRHGGHADILTPDLVKAWFREPVNLAGRCRVGAPLSTRRLHAGRSALPAACRCAALR